ncbi:MAG TPA: TatD family hydrolase [Firmicutes bacterium]|jgi:TatD DNase family protein|nr:TatD family hydrolase [Bacillota bacterium]
MNGGKAAALADSHAHLDFKDFDEDRENVLERAEKAGVQLIINVGFDMASSLRAVELAGKYSPIYAAVGIHPHEAARVPEGYLQKLEDMAKHPKVVAIGEIGLDFFRNRSPRPEQREVFQAQLALARRINLPVIIHDREAHDEIVETFEKEGLPEARGVIHCFSGDVALAKTLLDMGFYISIAGPVTYKKNIVLGQVASMVPPGRLLVETDAPFLPPHPLRGKRNEPAYVKYTAEKVAALRGRTLGYLGQQCLENTRNLFRI